mmetsp:Transcript_14974/g.40394  ORF Transcript_14974/g.40394 Transcript_14974/m.40394 type:complete len:422 (+) Transcript_14974:914-2179(+)
MHIEEGLDLPPDVVKAPRLVAHHGLGVAVHGVRDPGHHLARFLHSLHEAGQVVAQLGGAHAHDHGKAAWHVVRVQGRHQADQLPWVHLVRHLDTDGVLDAPQELHMGVVQLTRALTAPQEVSRAIVPATCRGVQASQGLLVVKQQRLMGGVELRLTHQRAGWVHTAGCHEGDGLIHAVGQVLVGLALWAVLHEVQVPLRHPGQATVATGAEATQQVERGSGLVVGLHEALRVGDARLGRELRAVDDIAPVRGQRHAIDGLVVGGAWLGELAGDAAQLDDGDAAPEGEHYRHLQQHPVEVPDAVGAELTEGLRAVAARDDKGIATGSLGHALLQRAALAREDERGHLGNLAKHLVHSCPVGVLGLLQSLILAPAVGLPVLWVLDGQHSLSRHHLPVSCYLGQHPGAEPGPRRSSGKGCSFRA